MGRAKLRMELMSNKRARLKAFEKRKKGLEKAAYELSTLCGVDVGMIVYGPAANNECNEAKIWPRNHEVVARLIDSYRLKPVHDSRYRTYNLSEYFKDRTERTEEEIKKLRQNTREAKYAKWNEKYDCLSQDELREFDRLLVAKISAVEERISSMKGSRSLLTELDVLMNLSVQESATFMQQQQPVAYYDTSDASMNASVQESAIFMQKQQPVAYYDTSDVSLNALVQESAIFMQQQQPVAYYNTPGVSMNASAQESAIFMPNIVQQQQPLAYYDTKDSKGNLLEGSRNVCLEESKLLMNPSVQETAFFVPDIVQQQQPLPHHASQDNMGNLMDGSSSSLYVESKFSTNPSVQESAFFMPDIIQQQQPLAYYDIHDNLMEDSRSLYLQSQLLMNPLVQGTACFMPDIVQEPQPLAYHDAQNDMRYWGKTMMMHDGASCSQGVCSYGCK